MANYKRRNYFIDKGAQSRFIAGFVAASVAGGVVAVFCFRYLSQKKLDDTLYSMHFPEGPVSFLLMGEMLITSAVAALFVIVFFALTARKVMSRIDGPLRKMSSSVKKITAGDLRSEVKFKENDEFKQFAGEVNEMVKVMNSRLTQIKIHADKIEDFVEKGGDAAVVGEIQREYATLKKSMQDFKL